MAKGTYNYFEQFKRQMVLCTKAANQLKEMLDDFTDVNAKADRIHDTEHEADQNLHELMSELNRSFITPIDREDIVQLANELDNITDAIEDVSNLFDMMSITQVRPDAVKLAVLIVDACNALSLVIEEFSHFKSSKNMTEQIIKVNKVEETGDKVHRASIKKMFIEETDAIEIMKWKEIYDMMETVLDGCEDVANLLDGIVIKNS